MTVAQKKYQEVETKLTAVLAKLRDYQYIINNLKKENIQLKQELARHEQVEKEWREKHKVLTATQNLLKKEDRTEIKKEISEIVREIDNCIGYLKGK